MAGAMAAGLKAQLDAQMEAARQQELVRIRQLDTSPVPTMVGSALDLMVDAFGTLEQRCSTMETELGDERAQRLEAERLAAEAAAASKQALEQALAAERQRAEAAMAAERERAEKALAAERDARAKGEAAAREAAERELKAQAERDRLSKEQAEKDRLEREAAEKAERERAEKERAEREAREAAAREALAKAAQSGDAPDFDLLIRNAVDAKLANLEASMRADLTDQMRSMIDKAVSSIQPVEAPPPEPEPLDPEEELERQRRLMLKIMNRMANMVIWTSWSHWLSLVKEAKAAEARRASRELEGSLGSVGKRCDQLGRAIDELRKTKATKDALSEAASELRQNIEQETQSRTKRQDALTGQLEKLNSDMGGFQTTTDGKLQEQNDRIAALEQQLKDQLEALSADADVEVMAAPADGEPVSAEWAQQISEMVRKMQASFKSKMAQLESAQTSFSEKTERGFVQSDESFVKVDTSLADLREKLASLSNDGELTELKHALFDRVHQGERDLRRRADHALQSSKRAMEAVKTLGYNVSGLDSNLAMADHFEPVDLGEEEDCVEIALTRRLEASRRCHTEDVPGHVVDLQRCYLESEVILARRARTEFVAELTRLHVDGLDEAEQAKLEQASLRRLDDAFAKAKKGRATVLASLFLAKSKASQKKDWRELAGTILQGAPSSHYADVTHDDPASHKVATLLESFEREIDEQRLHLRDELHHASFDPRDPRSSELESDPHHTPVAHSDLPQIADFSAKTFERRIDEDSEPVTGRCAVSHKHASENTVAARLQRLEASMLGERPRTPAPVPVATGGVSDEALKALEAGIAWRRHAAGRDTLQLLSGSSDALTLQDALENFGRRHQRPGDALEEAGRACTKASAALAQGEPVEGLWSLAETLSSIDDVEVKQVHGHLADVLEADLARRQYASANELRKKYEALAEAQNALAVTLAEVSGREAPQITITSDDRPPTPEVIVDRSPDPEIIEALEKLEMLVPTKAQQSSVDDLRDGLAELRQAQSKLIESSEMDVLRRLLETKAGRDQLEDILRRLKELEEAEPEEWEGLASTKCLSCNRPVTAPEYDEDEFSVVTGATGRTSLGSPVKLDPSMLKKRPLTGGHNAMGSSARAVLRDYPYPPPFPGPFSPPKRKSSLTRAREQKDVEVTFGEIPLHERLANVGKRPQGSQFLSPAQQAHLSAGVYRRRKELAVKGSGPRKLPHVERRNVVSPDSSQEDGLSLASSPPPFRERPRSVRMSSSVAG